MKKMLVLVVVVALFATMLFVTGCTQRDENLVGSWTWDIDSSWVTTFNEDGSGTHTVDWGYGATFTWSTQDGRLYWNYPGHSRMYTAYSVSGDQLAITMDDGMVLYYFR